jgi:phosphate starvation-inducible PhoH-like protein
LIHVQSVLSGIEGIHFSYFTEKDVVRHELVQKIIRAYESEVREKNHQGGGAGQ